MIAICCRDTSTYNNLYGLAAAFEAKGEKRLAEYYMLKHLDKDIVNFSLEPHPYTVLNRFFISYGLSTDTVLLDMMRRKWEDHYLQLDYPQASIGAELYWLNYWDQKIRLEENYWKDRCPDKDCEQRASDVCYHLDTLIQQRLLLLLEQNGGLFKKTQVGPAAGLEEIVLHHVTDVSIRENKIEPWYKKAVDEGFKSPISYFDVITQTLYIKGVPIEIVNKIKDSLFLTEGIEIKHNKL